MHPDAAEYTVTRTWLEWLASMPWKTVTEDHRDLHAAKAVLDEDHYGLEKVKDRILEYLAVRQLNPTGKGPVLCFIGPPGVGKTSLGRSIAKALGRSFQRVSLGGVKDEAEIRGHRRTYVGALPGRIVHAMKRAGTRNPVLVLDEIDKIGKDFRGDPSSALLEVLDPEQNHEFSDHYLDVAFDLSQVLFICTANLQDPIPAALHDRLEMLEIPGYIQEEKLQIVRRHLLSRLREAHGLSEKQITITNGAVQYIIESYTHEAGVRNLERRLASLHRKAARLFVEGRKRPLKVDEPASVTALLGPPRHFTELAERTDVPGVAIGLAWTESGGDILFIEVTGYASAGANLKLTGQLGDVMKESVEAALSFLRSRAESLGISPLVFKDSTLHVHVPAGGIPKDGPSAGVGMVTALASLLTGRCVRSHIAMTGEITLRGKVMPVGGIKEKVLAARRAGITEVILPRKNEPDLEDIPAQLRSELTYHFVDTVDEALALTLSEVATQPPFRPQSMEAAAQPPRAGGSDAPT
jgi:ATP-dependent Lon protease